MRVHDFQPDDLARIVRQGGRAFAGQAELLTQPGYGKMLKDMGGAWTITDGAVIVGCGGIVDEHANLGTAWTILDPVASGPRMVMIDRVARRIISSCPKRRIQATTDPDFALGRRWLKLLGFKFESLLEQYTPDGRDQVMFVRIR